MKARPSGLTLIELLVALSIFALLGTLTYRGTTQLMHAQRGVEQELARWRDINRAMHILENELLQIVAPSLPDGAIRLPPLQYPGPGGKGELTLLSLANPGIVERVAFRLRDERLEWSRRPDLQNDTLADTDILLNGVHAVRWRFLGQQGWVEQWPEAANRQSALPRAVELELTLPDTGPLRRLYALR